MRTLLLADDSLTIQRVIALTFAREPIRVVAVSDGQVAIEKMAAEQPDIVLAGTMLPQVSGYDLARRMRGTPELRDVPVLLLSGAFETVDEARLTASGANGVIEKPIEPTVVINRVKELLGLKSDEKPSATGRILAPVDGPGDTKATSRPGADLDQQAKPPASGASSAEQPKTDGEPSTKGGDYLQTLDSAFDSLDQHLSGKPEGAQAARNPPGPLAPSGSTADPRSPGQKLFTSAQAGNPVFEVDDDWFGNAESKARADARTGRQEIAEDLQSPELQAAAPAPTNPIFEVDDQWFADDDKARAAKLAEQQQLAKEMGIHEVDLPPVVAAVDLPVAASNSDFDFGMADFQAVTGAQATEPAAHSEPLSPTEPPAAEIVAPIEPPAAEIAAASEAPAAAMVAPVEPIVPVPTYVDALPATPQVDRSEPSAVAPAITSEALDQVAAQIVDRLQAGVLRDQWRDAMAVVAGVKVNEEKMDQIAARVADRLQPGAVEERLREVQSTVSSLQITDEKLDQISARVAARLQFGAVEERLRELNSAVSSAQITDDRLEHIATRVADRLQLGAVEERLREVSAAVSSLQITDEKLEHIAARVADRLQLGGVEQRLREVHSAVSSVQITDEKLEQIADRVSGRLPLGAIEERLRELHSAVSSQQLGDDKLDQIAANVAARLRHEGLGDQFREAMLTAMRDTVRSVVSETSERLVLEEIERIKSQEAAREDNVE